jgi:hypothetical protein
MPFGQRCGLSRGAHAVSAHTSSLRPQVNPYISACVLAENELTDDVALALAKSLRRKIIKPERTDPKLSRRAALYGMLHGAWQKSTRLSVRCRCAGSCACVAFVLLKL